MVKLMIFYLLHCNTSSYGTSTSKSNNRRLNVVQNGISKMSQVNGHTKINEEIARSYNSDRFLRNDHLLKHKMHIYYEQ